MNRKLPPVINYIIKFRVNFFISDCQEQLSVLDTAQIKQEDDLMNNCSLLDSPSLSHPMFDSIIDHNQFWHHNQIITPTGYYLPVNSSPYDHQSNTSYHLSTSDIDSSNSPIHDELAGLQSSPPRLVITSYVLQ